MWIQEVVRDHCGISEKELLPKSSGLATKNA